MKTTPQQDLAALEKRLKESGHLMTPEELTMIRKTADDLKEQIKASDDKRFVRALDEETSYLPSYRRHEADPLFNQNVI